MKKYFYCYSYSLKEFFIKYGLEYITVANNRSTGKQYWLFEGCDKLNTLLQQWRANR